MFDPRYPWLAICALTLATTGALGWRAAIASGWLKDPVMARFRTYGAERPYYPLGRLLDVLGWWSLLIASLLDALRRAPIDAHAPLIFLALTTLAWTGSVVVRQTTLLSHAAPPWYTYLMQTASREERRRIAHAWLRIPRAMRWRLNGDQRSFQVWADSVRITVVYGARRDPDNPWAH